MILRHAIMLFALAQLLAQAPQAAADPAADWQGGLDAFASGDFGSALAFFTGARDEGLAGPAVHYNIAVCQYELGDYAAARDTFRHIAARFPKMRGLAEYNAGLAERRLGNPIAARRRFIAAWYASNDRKVRALATAQLTELERDEIDDRYGLVNMVVGHDDNIALRDPLGLPAAASGESPLVEVFAMLNLPFKAVTGLAFDGGIHATEYSDADEYDQAELRAGIQYARDVTDWQFKAGLFVVTGTLGGSRFNEELNADVRATRYLSDAASIEARFRYDDIRVIGAMFEGIAGNRSRIDVRYRWNRLPHYLVVRVGVEDNNRRDESVSPDRRRLQATYSRRLSDRWDVELEASIRSSDYTGVAVSRNEQQATIAVGARHELDDNKALGVHYQYSENDSSDPLFSYQRNLVTVSLLYLF